MPGGRGRRVSLLTQTLGLLCVLAATVFATTTARRWQDIAGLLAGFVSATLWLRPEPAVVGTLTAVVALIQLLRPGWRTAGSAGAGVLAGLWALWLQGLGWPLAPALMVSAALPVAAAWLSLNRPSFAPVRVREEALFAVGALGVVVAAGPLVTTGWGSAAALNLPSSASATGPVAPAPWLFVAGAGVMLLGGVHSLWRRR